MPRTARAVALTVSVVLPLPSSRAADEPGPIPVRAAVGGGPFYVAQEVEVQVLAATSQYDVDGQSESVEQRTMQTPASEQNARSPCCEHSALVVQSVVQSGSDSASAQT